MSAPEAPRSTRNKPSLKCANEELITMNALGNRKTRKINSATSTLMPNIKAITPDSTLWYKRKPAAHTKARVAAAQSMTLLYICQTNDRKAASSGTTRFDGYFKPDRFRGE